MKQQFRQVVGEPLGQGLARICPEPNIWTVLGLAGSAVAAVIIAFGDPFWSAAAVLLASIFDMFDGSVARATGRVTPFGGWLDTVLDRVSEGLIFAAVALREPTVWMFLVAYAAVMTSFVVSYIKAAAFERGFPISSGEILGRPVRIGLLIVLLLLSSVVSLSLTLWAVVILNLCVSWTRSQEVWRLAQMRTRH